MSGREFSKVTFGNTKVISGPCASEMKARQANKIAAIRGALVADGVDTLAKQAAALRLSKSTAWAVLEAAHKSSGLSASVINRILRSPDLPPSARRVIEGYVHEKLLGAYGHNKIALMRFRLQLDHPIPLFTIDGRDPK